MVKYHTTQTVLEHVQPLETLEVAEPVIEVADVTGGAGGDQQHTATWPLSSAVFSLKKSKLIFNNTQ